jgi:sn-glycerol 3-phosphate transport system ATP-binding protein
VRGQTIELNQVSKFWGDTVALDDINLTVEPGTFTVLLGPSGCGKSTTLRIIAGLESASQGQVQIAGRDVSQLPPSQRDIAMVFQSYALFPHLTVAENILFGLKVRKIPKPEQRDRLEKTAETLGLAPYLARKPSQLSGGQQQRVALGRAIIAEKPICLMDEPLSNLDAKLRNTMRMEIRELQQSIGFTMVYVTHDQAEAITMADQVVLMQNGKIEQAGTPREIYEQPATTFVAGFIGTPPMNLAPIRSLIDSASNPTTKQAFESLAGRSGASGEPLIGIRPEHVVVAKSNGIRCRVRGVEYLGADMLIDCQLGESSFIARAPGSSALVSDDTVELDWDLGKSALFDDKTGQRIRVEGLSG